MFRVVFHLDMDAFFASVEQRDRPELRGLPVVVGSPPSQRGVVCAASYEARKFGIRSAMPSATAGRLCPRAVFIPVRMDAYKAESREIMAILHRTMGLVEPMSIDEAYLELTDVLAATNVRREYTPERHDHALETALPLAREIKRAIRAERNLTGTVGIASNKLLAKLASDFQKPDGLTLIRETEKVQFLRPLSVRALHGVGPVTESELNAQGIRTIGDLQDHRGDLRSILGSFAKELRQYAFGMDDRPLELDDVVKSISSEETFLRDTADRTVLRKSLKEQALEIAGKLDKRRLAAKTVQVKVRYHDFTTLTRQMSLEEPIRRHSEIYRMACFLLARERLVSRPLRLLGIGVAALVSPTARQLWLWEPELAR